MNCKLQFAFIWLAFVLLRLLKPAKSLHACVSLPAGALRSSPKIIQSDSSGTETSWWDVDQHLCVFVSFSHTACSSVSLQCMVRVGGHGSLLPQTASKSPFWRCENTKQLYNPTNCSRFIDTSAEFWLCSNPGHVTETTVPPSKDFYEISHSNITICLTSAAIFLSHSLSQVAGSRFIQISYVITFCKQLVHIMLCTNLFYKQRSWILWKLVLCTAGPF